MTTDRHSDGQEEPLTSTVEIFPLPDFGEGSGDPRAGVWSRELYRWRPPEQLRCLLPSWFEIALECSTDDAGRRTFAPFDPRELPEWRENVGLLRFFASPASVASVGGRCILEVRGEWPQDELLTSGEARLLVQYIKHRREYLGRTRSLGRAINICAGARSDVSDSNILPADLGLNSAGEGKVWTAAKLRDEGLGAAKEIGLESPDPEQVLRLALLEAAKLNPLPLPPSECLSLVRLTLFALPEVSSIGPDDLAYVATHVKRSIADHLNDSDEEFQCWIEDPEANLLRRISKRTDCPLERQAVAFALLELGWRSFQLIGRCVDEQMRAFRDAIVPNLTEGESFHFGQRFLANPVYGELPMLLLSDRLDFLKEAITQVWQTGGNAEAVAVLHRMMDYYAQLVGKRRGADREYKRRSATTRVAFEPVEETQPAPRTSGVMNRKFNEISRRLALTQGHDCSFGDDSWRATLDTEESNESIFSISIFCAARSLSLQIQVPREQFEQVAHEVCSETDDWDDI